MMRRVELDVRHIYTVKALHVYLAYMLDFPAHYGRNLDALFDLLSTESEPTAITLLTPAPDGSEVNAYLPRLIDVFQDSMQENAKISFEIKN